MNLLNVQIEAPLYDLDEMSNLMTIVKQATNKRLGADPLSDLIKELDFVLPTNNKLDYGKGGNHIWVSYRNERILLITLNNK